MASARGWGSAQALDALPLSQAPVLPTWGPSRSCRTAGGHEGTYTSLGIKMAPSCPVHIQSPCSCPGRTRGPRRGGKRQWEKRSPGWRSPRGAVREQKEHVSRFRPPPHGLSMQTDRDLTLEGKHPVAIEIKRAERETETGCSHLPCGLRREQVLSSPLRSWPRALPGETRGVDRPGRGGTHPSTGNPDVGEKGTSASCLHPPGIRCQSPSVLTIATALELPGPGFLCPLGLAKGQCVKERWRLDPALAASPTQHISDGCGLASREAAPPLPISPRQVPMWPWSLGSHL